MRNLAEMLPMAEITKFCQHWKIQEFAVFGSVLRADFNSESDIDFVVTFDDDAEWGLLDHIRMQQELQVLLQRDVDLVTNRAVERSQNWRRRKEIQSAAFVVFPERETKYASRHDYSMCGVMLSWSFLSARRHMGRDEGTLLDIARAAHAVLAFTQGLQKEEFLEDPKTQSAVLYQLIVMGEAVKQLSFEFRPQHPEIPWAPMAGMRDHLIHGYDVVDWDEVWRTATRDVPDLLSKLEAFLPQEDFEEE